MSNDFFSFVNKIGSLININNNSDTDGNNQNSNNNKSKNKRNLPSLNVGEKVYNIKMSEDTKEETLNIKTNDMGEEEEEEEEYEEDEKEIDKKEGPHKNNLNKENNNNILNNNNNKNEKKNIIYSSNKVLPEFDYDGYYSSHLMLKKGNDFYINDFEIIPVILLEKQKNIFYKLKMFSKVIKEPKDYLLFLDEHFLYFAKDELIEEEFEDFKDEYKRRISKIVSLYDLCDISFEKSNSGRYMIKLEIKNSKGVMKMMEFSVIDYFFNIFMKKINIKLSLYGIDFFSNKNSI